MKLGVSANAVVVLTEQVIGRGLVIGPVVHDTLQNVFLEVAEASALENEVAPDPQPLLRTVWIGVLDLAHRPVRVRIDNVQIVWLLVAAFVEVRLLHRPNWPRVPLGIFILLQLLHELLPRVRSLLEACLLRQLLHVRIFAVHAVINVLVMLALILFVGQQGHLAEVNLVALVEGPRVRVRDLFTLRVQLRLLVCVVRCQDLGPLGHVGVPISLRAATVVRHQVLVICLKI